MKLINNILLELIAISTDYNKDFISKHECSVKIDLLITQIDQLEINFTKEPLSHLDARVIQSLNQLLFRTKFKSIDSLNALKNATNKQSFNSRLRWILKCKAYFKPLHRTLQTSIEAYKARNELYYCKEFQIFVMKEIEENE